MCFDVNNDQKWRILTYFAIYPPQVKKTEKFKEKYYSDPDSSAESIHRLIKRIRPTYVGEFEWFLEEDKYIGHFWSFLRILQNRVVLIPTPAKGGKNKIFSKIIFETWFCP